MQNRVVNPYHLALIGGRNSEEKRGKGGGGERKRKLVTE